VLERDHEVAHVRALSDLAGFRTACDEGRWEEAFALYRGPFLDGFELDGAEEFASWVRSERLALEEAWRGACRAMLQAAEGAGRWSDAVRFADLLIRADPLDESATRDAMRLAAAAGDVHGAVRRYRALAAALEEEIGLDPEPATTAMLAALRKAAESAPSPRNATPAPAPGHTDRVGSEDVTAAPEASIGASPHVLLPPRVAGR